MLVLRTAGYVITILRKYRRSSHLHSLSRDYSIVLPE